jgi:tRNA1Val (adenine37-N6)-methyltransferase
MDLKERIDDLEYKGLKLIQYEDKYCFNSDSVLLANMVKASSHSIVIDLGAGSGIISILIAAKTNAEKIYAIEIQELMSNLCKKNIQFNNLTEKIEVINSDMKDVNKIIGNNVCDIVVTNPPYSIKNDKMVNEDMDIAICRHEIKINLKEVIESADKLLKFGGKLYIVHKAERLAELFNELQKAKIEPKNLICILPKVKKPVDTVIIEAVKGGGKGLKISTLTVYNDDNTMTDEAKKLYCKE